MKIEELKALSPSWDNKVRIVKTNIVICMMF